MEQSDYPPVPGDSIETLARKKRTDAIWWVVVGLILALLTAGGLWLASDFNQLQDEFHEQSIALAAKELQDDQEHAVISELREEIAAINAQNGDEQTKERLEQLEELINSIGTGNTSDVVVIPGPPGDQGAKGDKGDKGDAGADSTVPGPKGDTGDTGADSTVPGPEGPGGPAGEDGTDGTDGADGTNGTDGKDGADGADGKDGVGIASMTCEIVSGPASVVLSFDVLLTDGNRLKFFCPPAP